MIATKVDTSERRFEIECKLEAEIASLESWKESREYNNKLTNSMVSILSSLDQRLAKLRETIMPVYNETGSLQYQLHNYEKTTTLMDQAIGYYGVCQEVEGSVRAGPNGPRGLNAFLDSMNRLYNAQRYFQKNNPSSVELENVSSLFVIGLEALYAEFNDILARQSKPVRPIVLLDLIGSDEDTSNEDAPPSLCQLPESTLEDLVKLSKWLEDRGHRRHAKLYASVRSGVVLKSLQLMKEHQKSASGGSTHASSPIPRLKFNKSAIAMGENSSRRTSRRLQHAIERKATKMLTKAAQSAYLGLNFPTSRKQAPQPSGHAMEDAAPDEQEMENYLLLTASLHKLMQAERVLVARVLSTGMQPQVLEATVRDAMDLVVLDGESIAARAKRCVARRDFSAVLVVFPILKHLGELKPDLERTVEGCDDALRSKFRNLISTLNETGAKALEDFAESVRNESGSVLPKDGTVAESTSNVLVFLEQLAEYADAAGAVLRKHSTDSSSFAGSKPQDSQQRILLAYYIKKVIAQLNLALVSKSDTLYSDPALRALFRMNNNSYVIKALRRSQLMELLLLAESTAEKTYQDILLKDKNNYVSATFSKAKAYIEQSNDEPDFAPKVLKEKFAGFSREFEEAARCQHGYSVPDATTREELRKELQRSLVPVYATFYRKYSTAQFSKNPSKYIKYTPDGVAEAINTFFDTAA